MDEPPIPLFSLGIALCLLAGLLAGGLKAISHLAKEESEEWIVPAARGGSLLRYWLRRPVHLYLAGIAAQTAVLAGVVLSFRAALAGWVGSAPPALPLLVLLLSAAGIGPALIGGQLLGLRFPRLFAGLVSPLLVVPYAVSLPVLVPLARLLGRGRQGAGLRLASEFVPFPGIHRALESQEANGGLEKEEREMISSIFDFGDTTVREIMVPRIDITAIEAGMPRDEVLELFRTAGYSRLPVYEGRIDNIVGLLHVKDLLKVPAGDDGRSLKKLLRPPYFVPESKKIDDMLTEFQKSKIQLAIVVDEYGGTSGLVTIEDVLEEIVGEIHDEYDRVEAPFEFLDENTALVRAKTDLHDLNEAFQIDLPTEEYDTLGGFLYHQAERIPEQGEIIEYEDLRFTIEQVKGQRIILVSLRKDDLRRQAKSGTA